MIYKQLSYLPIIFQVDEEILLNVSEYLSRNKLAFTNVLVVSGHEYSKKISESIAKSNNWNTYVLYGNTSHDVENLKKHVNSANIDLIVGVGGGKVIDTVKRVSYLSNTNNLSIPTIISNDGLISPISVIKNESGKTESLPGMMPMGVIIDIDVIKDSPLKFIQAATGDILANISATNDWILAFQMNTETMNDIAFHLSKSAANSLLHFDEIDLQAKPFLRLLVQGLVNSGISMALAGTSRPCSGSEHQISHAIDFLNYGTDALHGIQVGSISLFTLFLQNKIERKHVDFAINTGIPLFFDSLITDFGDERFEEILNKSRVMRPGRYSVLDLFDNSEIKGRYSDFKTMVHNWLN